MATFDLLDLDRWSRSEYFTHYTQAVPCTYSVTVNIDITGLRSALAERNLRAYLTQVYMLATVVNRFPEFRMGIDDHGAPGIWSLVHPAYTVFNRERETFASIWTPYEPDFRSFHKAAAADLARHGGATTLHPQSDVPANVFDISSLPWLSFTGFNLNIGATTPHLPPIFTIGKYLEQDGATYMPLAMQVHHAACDGFHASRFVNALQDMATSWEDWIDTPA